MTAQILPFPARMPSKRAGTVAGPQNLPVPPTGLRPGDFIEIGPVMGWIDRVSRDPQGDPVLIVRAINRDYAVNVGVAARMTQRPSDSE